LLFIRRDYCFGLMSVWLPVYRYSELSRAIHAPTRWTQQMPISAHILDIHQLHASANHTFLQVLEKETLYQPRLACRRQCHCYLVLLVSTRGTVDLLLPYPLQQLCEQRWRVFL
jgi:hypothetical protein